MTVTVIVPAWGSTPFLAEALDSVRRQTYADVELIIARPPDGRKTLAEARRAGLSRATGDWIMFLDADDELLPEAIARHVELVDDETDVVVSGLLRGTTTRRWNTDIWTTGPSDVFNCLVAKLVRRTLFADIRWDASVVLGEDLMITGQLLRRARKVVIAEGSYYRYRENPASLTHSLEGCKRVLDLMRVGEILREEMPEERYADFHDRVTRDVMLLWCRYLLLDRTIWRSLRIRLRSPLLADPRHGIVKKGVLAFASFIFD